MPDVFNFAFAIVIIVIVLIFPIKEEVAVNISAVTVKLGKCPLKLQDPFVSTNITNFSLKSQDF